MKTCLLVVVVCGSALAAEGRAERRHQASVPLDALARTRAYLVDYQAKLPSLVAEEFYVQNQSGAVGTIPQKRTTRSDLLMVRLPGNAGWMTFRDVFDVDGRPIRDREDRLLKLLQAPTTDALSQARRIAEEGSRFNLGRLSRTINVPDVALPYLHPDHQNKVKVEAPRRAAIDGADTLVFRFRETSGPTIITSPTRRDVPAQGRVWADPVTGAIVRTELTLMSRASTAVCIVDFQLDARLGVRVPVKMTERYTASGEYVVATATYSNFRQFQVSTAVTVGKPPGR